MNAERPESGAAGAPALIAPLAERASPKAFADRDVSPRVLESLFEAFRWAPSCYNDQPWRLVVGLRSAADDTYARLAACLSERNRLWATTAPVLMLSVAVTCYRHSGEPNRFAQHDVGLAMGALAAQATALGLSLHQMGGYDRDAARATFEIPEDAEPMAAVALGYRGGPERLPDGVIERAPAGRERLPVASIVFTGHFGQAFQAK